MIPEQHGCMCCMEEKPTKGGRVITDRAGPVLEFTCADCLELEELEGARKDTLPFPFSQVSGDLMKRHRARTQQLDARNKPIEPAQDWVKKLFPALPTQGKKG